MKYKILIDKKEGIVGVSSLPVGLFIEETTKEANPWQFRSVTKDLPAQVYMEGTWNPASASKESPTGAAIGRLELLEIALRKNLRNALQGELITTEIEGNKVTWVVSHVEMLKMIKKLS